MHLLEAPRLKLPVIADFNVLVIVEAGAEPRHIVAGLAQLNIAAAARPSAAFQLNHVVVDVRPWGQVGQALAVGLEQIVAAHRFVFTLISNNRELAVLGEQTDDSFDVAAPHAITVALR